MSENSDASVWSSILALCVVLLFSLHGCPNKEQARDILAAEGYTAVKVGSAPAGSFSCGEDNSATGFSAQTSAGHPVKGVVCCGLVVKACTVRITEAGR